MTDEIAHQAWSSRLAFILVSIGATVGLGNLWRFPFAAGESGAGAFVLVYLLAVFIIAAPLFMAETLIGRFGRHSAPTRCAYWPASAANPRTGGTSAGCAS